MLDRWELSEEAFLIWKEPRVFRALARVMSSHRHVGRQGRGWKVPPGGEGGEGGVCGRAVPGSQSPRSGTG